MTARETTAPTSPQLDRLRAEQVRLLYANGGFPMLVTGFVSLGLASLLVYQRVLSPIVAAIWIGAIAAHTLVRQLVRLRYIRTRPPDADWRRWANRFVAGSLAGGVTWGAGVLWLLVPGRFDLQMLVVTVLIAIVYGTMTGFGSYLPAFFVLFLPAIAPAVVWFGLQGDVKHYVCFVLFLAWAPTVVVLARRYNATLIEALRLRFENADLVEDLTAQKAIAEQASLAKSRFLASASHDLRQPVHALGMFIGALRSHRLPKRSVALIDHLDASIAALDGLFTSLLDISKLDAGVVESRVSVVPLEPLIGRICRDLEGEAAQKGVALTWRPTDLAVWSDPMLLERILRNLIGNAARYTDRGRILVGCRRRGPGVSLEVWDTGPGIAPALREAVFEEFYQVSNPDRDRAKGLGLGLPIVRRLTAILDHPLTLESWPGEGSVFRVTAPRAPYVQRVPATGRGDSVLAGLKSALILAIDDESAIRTAMAELLRGWGHRVIVAADEAEALSALAAEGAAPDLIVCDYRLRDGANGVDLIRRLQVAVGVEIPAILVTGDTAPENIRRAQASGYPLLHKPLSHVRLRAAVSSLIRRPSRRSAAG